ncbi:MAG: hypothetical protein HDT30_00995 [Clostridiales bacterium]|nr:hypothetical protein [Clostridiales bacterium]
MANQTGVQAGAGVEPVQQGTQEPAQQTQNNQGTSNNTVSGQQAPQIDYDKIQSMIDKGTQQKEDAILKGYFQKQGLTEEEAQQAMAAFKQQKAAKTPDVAGLQTQVQTLQTQAQQAVIEKDATIGAIALGLDVKQVPYILKMADFSKAMDKDGKTNPEAIKEAINKVLEDFPQLKPQKEENKGFQKVGASGGNQEPQQTTQNSITSKRWNRFNY